MTYQPRPLSPGFLDRPIAHRGLHDAWAGIIENTAPAFAAAIANGYGIECDVQPSAEAEPMVFHDPTLDRLTTAHGPVLAHPAADLLALPFKAGKAGMMTLEALLAMVAGKVPLVVEVKSAFDGKTPLAPRIAALAATYTGPLVFKSFDPAQIIALRAAGVNQPLGMVVTRQLDEPALSAAQARALGTLEHLASSRPDFLSWAAGELPNPMPAMLRASPGLPLMCWTLRSAQEAARVAPFVDQIVFEGFRPRSAP